MKKAFLILFLASALMAEETAFDKSIAAAESVSTKTPDPKACTYWSIHPIHIGGNALQIGQADITDTPRKGHLTFGKYNAFLYALVPINEKNFFLPRVEWNTFTMDWNKNPKFNTTQFYFAQFGLTFYSNALDKWRWILRADYNLDTKHFNRPSQYGLFTGLIWGSHEVGKHWHYHIGGLGYTGMEGNQIYPVIGGDYSPNKHWTFLAIFPIEYYIRYKLDEHWRFSLKVRPLKERFRAGRDQPQPRSVFSYSSTGAELNVLYEIFMRLDLEAYVGWNFGGSFYIKNIHGHKPLYTDVGGAPYGGLSLNWGI